MAKGKYVLYKLHRMIFNLCVIYANLNCRTSKTYVIGI